MVSGNWYHQRENDQLERLQSQCIDAAGFGLDLTVLKRLKRLPINSPKMVTSSNA